MTIVLDVKTTFQSDGGGYKIEIYTQSDPDAFLVKEYSGQGNAIPMNIYAISRLKAMRELLPNLLKEFGEPI